MEPQAFKVLSFTDALKRPLDVEPFDSVSVTVPNMSYSVKELVRRFSVGSLPDDVIRQVMYTDNPDFDDFIDTELGDFDFVDAYRELDKLRELHALRMERRKAVSDAQQNVPPEASPDASAASS